MSKNKRGNGFLTLFLIALASILLLGISSNLVRGSIGDNADASSSLRDDEKESVSASESEKEEESLTEKEEDPETPDVPEIPDDPEMPDVPEIPDDPETPTEAVFSGESDVLLSTVTTYGETAIDASNGTVDVVKGSDNAFEFVFDAPVAGVYALQMAYANPTEWSNSYLDITSASASYLTRLHYGGNTACDQVAGTDVAYRYLTAGENTVTVYAESDSFSLSGISITLEQAVDHSISGSVLRYSCGLKRTDVSQGFVSGIGTYMLRHAFASGLTDSVTFKYTPTKTAYYNVLAMVTGVTLLSLTSDSGHSYVSDFKPYIADYYSTCYGCFELPTAFYMQANITYTFTFTGVGYGDVGQWTHVAGFHFIETDAPELPDVSSDVPTYVTIPEGETAVAYVNAADLPGVNTNFAPRVEGIEADAVLSVPLTGFVAAKTYKIRFLVSDAYGSSDDVSSLSCLTDYGAVVKSDVTAEGSGFMVTYTFVSATNGAVSFSFAPGQRIDLDWVLVTEGA